MFVFSTSDSSSDVLMLSKVINLLIFGRGSGGDREGIESGSSLKVMCSL